MKTSFYKACVAAIVAISFMGAFTSAEAYQCRNVHGFWRNGNYHPAHRVCWQNHNRHCQWRNGQKVCWNN
jgi:hypothetical protein